MPHVVSPDGRTGPSLRAVAALPRGSAPLAGAAFLGLLGAQRAWLGAHDVGSLPSDVAGVGTRCSGLLLTQRRAVHGVLRLRPRGSRYSACRSSTRPTPIADGGAGRCPLAAPPASCSPCWAPTRGKPRAPLALTSRTNIQQNIQGRRGARRAPRKTRQRGSPRTGARAPSRARNGGEAWGARFPSVRVRDRRPCPRPRSPARLRWPAARAAAVSDRTTAAIARCPRSTAAGTASSTSTTSASTTSSLSPSSATSAEGPGDRARRRGRGDGSRVPRRLVVVVVVVGQGVRRRRHRPAGTTCLLQPPAAHGPGPAPPHIHRSAEVHHPKRPEPAPPGSTLAGPQIPYTARAQGKSLPLHGGRTWPPSWRYSRAALAPCGFLVWRRSVSSEVHVAPARSRTSFSSCVSFSSARSRRSRMIGDVLLAGEVDLLAPRSSRQ